MRDFLIWLLADRATPEIDVFNFFHILYFVLIIGLTFLGAYLLRDKSEETKRRTLEILIIAVAVLYFGDFFTHPLRDVGEDGLNAGIILDKFPFHLCTVLCPLGLFAQFNKRFEKIKEPIIILAVVGPLMYITYPNGAVGDISALCYKMLQTFLYHGTLFAWATLSITTGSIKPDLKKGWYKCLVSILVIAVWATLGNTVYNVEGGAHYDWFFLTGTSFFGEEKWFMPYILVTVIFAMCIAIYGCYYLGCYLVRRHAEKKAAPETAAPEREAVMK